MNQLFRIIYALFALGMLGIGTLGFSLPYGVLPETAAPFDEETLHIIQEASAGVIALGFLAGWCALRYEKSQAAHWVLTIFFLLIAAIHAVDYLQEQRSLQSPILNSVPALALMGIGFLRRKEDLSD